MRVLRSGGLARLADSLPRALIWTAMWNMTRDGDLATRDYVELVIASLAAETDIGIVQMAQRQVARALEVYADPAWAPEGSAALGRPVARGPAQLRARLGPPAGVGARVPRAASADADDVAVLTGLFDGSAPVEGLAVDRDLRWSLLQALVARGALARPPSTTRPPATTPPPVPGPRPPRGPCCRRPRRRRRPGPPPPPTTRCPTTSPAPTSAGSRRGCTPTSSRRSPSATSPRCARCGQRRTSELAQDVAVGLFPSWSSTIDQATLDRADRFLADTTLPSSLRRLVTEGRADLVRALHARTADHD